MYTLTDEEKMTTVMVYSRNKLIHGNLVTKKNVRVNIWLRMQDLPNYLHLLKTEVLIFGGAAPQSLAYEEYFFPVERVIGFHLAPPASEPLDYDTSELNRSMVDVNIILGMFALKGKVRASTDFGSTLEISHSNWLSVYDAQISNPLTPQMPTILTPMLLVNPKQVSFGF